MKRLADRTSKWVFTVSGFTTSAVIILIIAFLFTESAGLFSTPIVEEGYVLAVNRSNNVKDLNTEQIKNIFDGEITSWDEVGGKDMEIEIFRLEDLERIYTAEQLGAEYEHAGEKIAEQIYANPGIIAFIPESMIEGIPDIGFIDDRNIRIKDVLFGREWFPTATPSPIFGILPLILGTLWVSFFAILIALPFGISIAIYMAELASNKVRNILKPVIELLAGIPSVVYGFFGLVVIVPMIHSVFDLPVGESGLAGAIVLAIMALPTIITVAEDAIRSVPLTTKEASLALGASHLQTIFRVQSPYKTPDGKMKTECYVFDFAPDRTLKIVAETSKFSSMAKTSCKPASNCLRKLMFTIL